MASSRGLTRRNLLQSAVAAPALLRGRDARPNVLWLMSDEQRPDSLGCYGSPWAHSPVLDALASEGVLFESAYVPSPVCVPCRTALLTGHAASTNGVLHNQAALPDDARLLTWVFEDSGYETASFGKKHYFLKGSRQAFHTEGGRATDDVVDAQNYGAGYRAEEHDAVQYKGSPGAKEKRRWILAGRFPADESRTAEARNVALAIDWLSRRNSSKPFLLRLSMNAPHTPVVVPPKYLDLIDPDRIRLPGDGVFAGRPKREQVYLSAFQGSEWMTAAHIRKIRRYYYARAAFLDAMLGRLLDWMRSRDLLANTLIAFVSDHGAHLGDHGLLQKQTFYEQVVTVPFFFTTPGGIQRARLRRPVNTMSLLPTLIEVAGLQCPPVEAPSLARTLRTGAEPPANAIFSEIAFGYQGYRDNDRQVMVRSGRYKLSLFLDPADPAKFAGNADGALYDLERDPAETRNLYDAADYQTIRLNLERTIREWDRHRNSRPADKKSQ
jgi:arylsulfatase A-like enzyme